MTDTTEPFAADSEPDLAFAFSTDRPDDALLFTDAVIAEGGETGYPGGRTGRYAAAAEGMVCWEDVAAAAGPDDSVSFFGYGLVDGEEGEAYRIEPGPSRSQEGDDEDAAVNPPVRLSGVPPRRLPRRVIPVRRYSPRQLF